MKEVNGWSLRDREVKTEEGFKVYGEIRINGKMLVIQDKETARVIQAITDTEMVRIEGIREKNCYAVPKEVEK